MAGASNSMNINDLKIEVPDLNGENYTVWKERVLLYLGVADMDYAIRKDEPPSIGESSTQENIDLYEKWERSNRLCVMFIKTHISAGLRGSVEKYDNVRSLLKAIGEQFQTSEKSLASTLIGKFSSIRLTGLGGVREHIMKMRDIAAKLKTLEVEMSDTFLVHYILNTLPYQYGPFKISYNTHKDKWSMNELLTMCVQEESRLMMEQGETVLLVTNKKNDKQAKDKGKGKMPIKGGITKESKCFFCKKKGHIKKDCIKFQKWRKNKGHDKPEETSGK